MADFWTFKYTVVCARLALFDYEQRYIKTELLSFPWVEKNYSYFQGGERRKTG